MLDKIGLYGKIILLFSSVLCLWQITLILDKIFIDCKILFCFHKSFPVWQNILILDKIFIEPSEASLSSYQTPNCGKIPSEAKRKLASLEATLVQNSVHSLNRSLTDRGEV